MWIQPLLLVLLGVVAISAAMANKKAKTTKKHKKTSAMLPFLNDCSKETELVDCATSSCFCTEGDKTNNCAKPSTEHICPPPTTKCYYQTRDRRGVFVNDDGCGTIRAATYNYTCSDIVAYDRTKFAYYNCVDNKEPYGICANLEVCNYNDDNSSP